ncbi:uncharacterized protein LOC132902210 [Amyelois transitella]|uniref:uncharacterized protein LOC132902210 n=1 Tax=Amyelois transitella TaxID=680683 RepID=UPI00298F43B2|nr:uncharacterized protein LOC132902210 [Amyelois transitella]
MLNGYTYSQINYTVHWFCSSKMAGCLARIRRLPDGKILRVNTVHNHPPPNYVVCHDGKKENVKMIPTRSGKKFLLMLDSFTYSQINYSVRWVCSSKAQGCEARLRYYPSGEIVRVNTQHNHPPPKYICRNGVYIKL